MGADECLARLQVANGQTVLDFTTLYYEQHGVNPTWLGAAGAVAPCILATALQSAFTTCDTSAPHPVWLSTCKHECYIKVHM